MITIFSVTIGIGKLGTYIWETVGTITYFIEAKTHQEAIDKAALRFKGVAMHYAAKGMVAKGEISEGVLTW